MDNVLSAGLLVNKDKKALVKRAGELFAAVGINEETQKKFPAQISGGEAQRAGIVRALINHPEILFADEPTGALNSKTGLDVLDTLTMFNAQGQSVVMVTHDMCSARRGNRILYLKDGINLLAALCDDFSMANNQSICVEGRFPIYDNEMALAAKYAEEQGFIVGSEITLTAGGAEASYIISGFTQISSSLGKDCLLTRAGYEKLYVIDNLSYYLNLAEGTDTDAFNKEMQEKFPEDINAVINISSTIEGTASVYVSLMTIIVTAILILSIVIITFVLYLLVRTMLNHKKQEYGILKSLGFTTGQLIPVCFIVFAGIGLILFAFGTACILSMKIRKIVPRMLLAGE